MHQVPLEPRLDFARSQESGQRLPWGRNGEESVDVKNPKFRRDYQSVLACAEVDRDVRMKRTVDLFWEAFRLHSLSWIGFYLFDSSAPAGQELVLEECRDKPACSPIGLHGCCGRSFREKRPLIVRDVKVLGPNYIACDPKDQSEIVIPLFEVDGTCWGVLDGDSYDIGAFDESDVYGMTMVLEMMGLSVPQAAKLETIVL